MKNHGLILFFIAITLACVVLGGISSIQLIFKSALYTVGMGALLLVGLMYTINEFEDEVSE